MLLENKPRDPGEIPVPANATFGKIQDELHAAEAIEPLWPKPYREDSPKAAFRFLTECCWTYNEANAKIDRIPTHDYIRQVTETWHATRSEGCPYILEKSRRMIVSWTFRGLELWRCGLTKEAGIIAGLNYTKASEHVWRIWWLYERLRSNRPEFKLPACLPRGGSPAAHSLRQVVLPNGSIVEALNQDGQSFQGSGYSWVTMEEFSMYRNVDYMWSQALRVTEGIPGKVPGHVCVVTNASSNKAWHEIKRLKPEETCET